MEKKHIERPYPALGHNKKTEAGLRVEEAGLRWLVWTWPQLSVGDCVMQAGSTLTLFSDGTGYFKGTCWTNHTHSGDTWHQSMIVNDLGGNLLFVLNFDGPNHMNDDGTHYPFTVNYVYDKVLFPELGSPITAVYQC